jgi:hypothetical protein
MATTALDIISGALLNINSYSPGEPLQPQDAQTGLDALNDLIDSLANDECFMYVQQETVFLWVNGQYQYTVGNPVGGTFLGTVTGGSNVITGIAPMPPDMIVGGTLTDVGAVIPGGTAIAPVPTTITAIGVSSITMSAPASATPAINPDKITYTVPGNIVIGNVPGRPLRFRDGFTRATASGNANLDYAFEMISFDRYKEELLKNIQGPWPYVASYQPTFPYGTLYVYPAPSANYTAHIFTDIIIDRWPTTTTAYNLPQGYSRALKKLLALELAPSYGKTPSPFLVTQAKEAKDLIKGTNDVPVVTLRFDSAIARSQTNDAGWFTHGGFH